MAFNGWAIVEIMGHRVRAGRVSEEAIAGAALLRVDIPDGDGFRAEYYGGGAIFCLRPCSEAEARKAAAPHRGRLWDAPALPPRSEAEDLDEDPDGGDVFGPTQEDDAPDSGAPDSGTGWSAELEATWKAGKVDRFGRPVTAESREEGPSNG